MEPILRNAHNGPADAMHANHSHSTAQQHASQETDIIKLTPGSPQQFSRAAEAQWSRRLAEKHQHPHSALRPTRTGIDVMTEFMHDLRNDGSPGVSDAKIATRQQWLRGNFSTEATRAYLTRIATSFGDKPSNIHIVAASEKALRKLAGGERSTAPSLKELHENPFGRHYESVLARRMVERPTTESCNAAFRHARFQRTYFTHSYNLVSSEQQQYFLDQFAQLLRDDMRPWFVHTPQVVSFVHGPSSEKFHALLSDPNTGFDIILHQLLTVKLSTLLHEWKASPRWMQSADPHYRNVIGPARSVTRVPASEAVFSNRFGTGLAGQSPFSRIEGAPKVFSWPDAKMPDFETLEQIREAGLPSFEVQALLHGHAVVNGASGSANILAHFNDQIKNVDPDFPKGAGMLNSMAFLTYDGGHSLNEAMAVRHMLDIRGDTDMRRNALNGYRLDYRDLPNLLRSTESCDILTEQMEQSIDETVAYFTENGYRRRSFDGTSSFSA